MEEWKDFASENAENLKYVAASSGTGKEDFERLSNVLTAVPELSFICLDVANGYSQHFVEYVRKVRAEFPNHTIIVSNYIIIFKEKITEIKFFTTNLDLVFESKDLLLLL